MKKNAEKMTMKTFKVRKILLALLALALFTACGGGQKKELNRMLLDMADDDQVVDVQEWEQLVEFLDGQKPTSRSSSRMATSMPKR